MPKAHWLLCKAMRLKFAIMFRMSHGLDLDETEICEVQFLKSSPFFAFMHKDDKFYMTITFILISQTFGPDKLQLFPSFFLLSLQNFIGPREEGGGTRMFVRMSWISCTLH
jgi:hypothetical protein